MLNGLVKVLMISARGDTGDAASFTTEKIEFHLDTR